MLSNTACYDFKLRLQWWVAAEAPRRVAGGRLLLRGPGGAPGVICRCSPALEPGYCGGLGSAPGSASAGPMGLSLLVSKIGAGCSAATVFGAASFVSVIQPRR